MAIMLHAGGVKASRQDIFAVQTPSAEGRWFPIPHDLFLNQIHRGLEALNFNVTKEQYALAKEGNRMFGILDLYSPRTDRTTILGLRNAHDRSFAAEIIVGNRVFVCDNLAFSGQIKTIRRHTTNIERDLPRLIDLSLGKLTAFETAQDNRIEIYQHTNLSTRQINHLLMETLRAQIVAGSTIPKIIQEFDHPSFPEFKETSAMWRLYNAITFHLKNQAMDILPRKTMLLNTVFDAEAEIYTPELT